MAPGFLRRPGVGVVEITGVIGGSLRVPFIHVYSTDCGPISGSSR